MFYTIFNLILYLVGMEDEGRGERRQFRRCTDTYGWKGDKNFITGEGGAPLLLPPPRKKAQNDDNKSSKNATESGTQCRLCTDVAPRTCRLQCRTRQ